MKVWRMKKGSDRRFRQGHPWVFASELGHSTKEVIAGEVVELRDASNHFLAFGYAHPSSQICFRRLSSRAQDQEVLSVEFFARRLRQARELRMCAGWVKDSHRWLFAEADGVPGLVVDAFRSPEMGWVVVAQASTAGIDKNIQNLFTAIEGFKSELGELVIVEAPSSRSRSLEGLSVGPKRVVHGSAAGLQDFAIALREGLELRTDLLNGQKTGFFLDQQWNSGLMRQLLETRLQMGGEGPIHILDICCYVGQWSARAVQTVRESAKNRPALVTLMDTSGAALELARANLERVGAHEVELKVGDALEQLSQVLAGHYDVVICDPPAFVKKRADLPSGLMAYTKLMRDAMRATKPGGLLVASSCSGLVKGEDWQGVLQQASAKASRTYKMLVRGGHGPDHPVRPDFPEGEYLKCEIGEMDYPF